RLDHAFHFRTGKRAHHSRERRRFGNVNARDFCVTIRRPHETNVQHTGQLLVIDKNAFSAYQAVFFFAANRLTTPLCRTAPVAGGRLRTRLCVRLCFLGARDSRHGLRPMPLECYPSAFCKPSINFCTFFFAKGSSMPPAREAIRPTMVDCPSQ